MKKLLTLLLIMCITLSNIPLSVSAGEADLDFQTENLRVLSELKIIPDIEGVDLNSPVNRGTFAKYICNLLNNHSSGTTVFGDVGKDAEFYAPVSCLGDLGIVSGDEYGNFNPYDYIEGDHAVKMVVEALGYNIRAHIEGGYVIGYNSIAKKLGLLDGVKFENETATLGELSNLIYNSLFTALYRLTSINGVWNTFAPINETVLSQYHNIHSDRGIVTANEYTGLGDLADKAGGNSITVNGVTYKSTQDLSSLIGYTVTVFYDKDTLNLKSYKKEDKFRELIIDAADIAGYDRSNGRLTYYTDSNDIEDVTLRSGASVLFNGALYEGILTETIFKPECGDVKLLDNNNDGQYDVCFINSYVIYVLGSTPGTYETIVDKIGVQSPLRLDGKDYKVVSSLGEVSLQSLKENSVLMVAPQHIEKRQITQNGKTIEILACDTVKSEFYNIYVAETEAMQGVVSRVIDGERVIIGDNTYDISKQYLKYSQITINAFSPVAIGENIEFLLDSKGRIVYACAAADKNDKYGWLIALGKEDKALNETVRAKIFDSDGNMGTYELNKKLKVTKQWTTGGEVQSKSVNAVDLLGYSELFSPSFIQQLIKFSKDEEGNINSIELALNNVNDANKAVKTNNTFSVDKVVGESEKISHHEPQTFACTYEITSATQMFDIPVGSDNKNYFSAKKKTFGNDEGVQFVSFYNVKDNGEIGILVKFRRYTGNSDRGSGVAWGNRKNAFIFDSLSSILDEEGNVCYQLNGYIAGKAASYYVSNNEMLCNSRGDKNSTNPDIAKLSNLKVTDLKPGDQLLLETSRDVEITGFLVLAHNISSKAYDEMSGTNYDDTEIGKHADYYGVLRLFCGTVDKKIGKYTYINTNNINGYLRRMRPFDYYYCLNTKKNKVEVVSSNDLTEGDHVYAYITYGNYKSAVIVK